MCKKAFREKYLTLRKNLSRGEILDKSGEICKKVLELDVFKDAKTVSIYLPVNNEVETSDIITRLVAEGKRIFLPKHTDTSEVNDYVFAKFTGWQKLEKGPHGIMEPIYTSKVGSDSFEVSSFAIDLAIIPGVAFDKRGVRLGYGKGVFDRLLANSLALKIGLAYDFQIVDELPKEEHDLVMDVVVTEARLVRINPRF